MATSSIKQSLYTRPHQRNRANLDNLHTAQSEIFFDDTDRHSVQRHDDFRDPHHMRLDELSATISNALLAIKNDQLLSTMLEEQTSKEFAQQRIKEIIEECIDNDRETLIEQLSHKYQVLETEYIALEQEYTKVRFLFL